MTNLPAALLSVFFSKLFVLVLAFIFTPVLVRLLGPTAYGQYALTLSVFGLVSVVIIGGTSDAVRKYISERSDPDWQASVFAYVFRPTLLLGLVTGASFIFAAWSGIVENIFGEAFTSLFFLLGGYAVSKQLSNFSLRTLMGLKRESRSEPLKVLEKLLFVTVALVFLTLGFGVEGVLVAHIGASMVVFVVALGSITRVLSIRSILSPPAVDVPKRRIVHYIGGTIVFFLSLTSLYHVDVILLQYWWTDEIVGYYRGALSIAEFLWVAPVAVQLVLLQRVSQLWREKNLQAIQRQSQLVTQFVLLFTLLLAMGIATLASDFVPLYLGDAFTPSITPLLLLLPGVVGFAVARPTLAINQGRRSLRPLIVATIGCSIVNLLLNLLLIPPYGMVGAAVATSVGYVSLVVFQSMAARHLGYAPLNGVRLGPTAVTAAACAAVIVPVAHLLSSPILSLVVVPPLGAAVYVTVSISSGAITHDEIRYALDTMDVVPNQIEQRVLFVIDRIPGIRN